MTLTAIAIGSFGHRVAAVAAHLHKNPGTVSRCLAIAERRQSEDEAYRDELCLLTEQIAAAGNARKEYVAHMFPPSTAF